MNPEKKNAKLWTKNFAMILLVNLLLYLGFQMLLPVIPMYAASLGASDSLVGWVYGVFVVSAFLIRPFVGYLLDKTGRFVLLVVGAAIIAASVFSYGLVSSVALLVVLRLIHGVGWGSFHTAAATVTADSAPPERMGEGMSYFGFTSSIAIALSPIIALYILNRSGFGWTFGISAAFAAASLFMSFFIKYKKIDSETAAKAKIIVFEKTALRPAIVAFFVTPTFGAITGFVPLYAIQANLEDSGLFFAAYAITLLVARPATGKIVDRFGVGYCVVPGTILLFLALVLLSVAYGPAMFVMVAVLYGLGFGACHSSLQAMAVMNTPADRFGAANATFLTMFDCGLAIGAIISGMFASAFGYGRMFLIMSGFAVISLVLFLLTARKKSAPSADAEAHGEALVRAAADAHEGGLNSNDEKG